MSILETEAIKKIYTTRFSNKKTNKTANIAIFKRKSSNNKLAL